MVDMKDTWGIVNDAFGDYLGKGKGLLEIIKLFEGKSYAEMQCPFFKISYKKGYCKTKNIQDINGVKFNARKYLKFFYKLGFIDIYPKIRITEKGKELLNSRNDDKRKIILRGCLEDLYYWNPTEKNMSEDFDIYPYRATLFILSELGHLTKKEVGNYLIRLKSDNEIEGLIKEIKDRRDKKIELKDLDINFKNRSTWIMSLFSSTDLMIIEKNNLKLNKDKLEIIKQILNKEDLEIEENFEETPLTRRLYSLKKAKIRFPKKIQAKSSYYTRNYEALEKANNIHQELVKIIAEELPKNKKLPEMSIRIDLLSRSKRNILLFEMKSLTRKNERTQIMKAFSQLNEYSYFDLSEETNPIIKAIFLEREPIKEHLDFLLNHDIYVLWRENNQIKGDKKSLEIFKKFLKE